MSRERTPDELAEDIAELKTMVVDIGHKIDELPFVRVDVYQAKHHALRNEVTAEFARLHVDIEKETTARRAAIVTVEGTVNSARALAMWSLGLICTAVIGGIVAFLSQVGGS